MSVLYMCMYTRENSKRRDGILFIPSFHPSLFLTPCPCLCRFISMTVPVLCLPLSLTFLVSGCHPLGLSLSSPQRPLTQHPVSLGWHRSAGYLGNDCRASTCDWPGWGPTLGWWADLAGGESCPQSPLGEGHSLERERNPSVPWWAGLPSWGGNSCPNEDSELQNEAT